MSGAPIFDVFVRVFGSQGIRRWCWWFLLPPRWMTTKPVPLAKHGT